MLPSEPIAATADDLAWLTGRWLGDDGADRLEELWMAPHAGMLLGMFRWHRNGQPRFYELMSVEPDGSGLVFRIKHFDPGLKGWEEKDETVALDLVAMGDNEATFLKRGEQRWMVYRHDPSTNELIAWFETLAQPHQPGDEFRYQRA